MRGPFVTAVTAALLMGPIAAVSPIQKVLEMMDEMKAKCVKEKNDEVVTFTKYQAFCQDTAAEKTKAIDDAVESIAQLAADIQKYDSDSTVLAEEIGKLDGSIATAEDQLAAATDVRNKEKADFDAVHGEYTDNIAQLEGAVAKIKTMMSTVKSASLLQIRDEILPRTSLKSHTKTMAMVKEFFDIANDAVVTNKAFLDMGDGQQPAAPVYESKAGGVVELMKDLKKKLIEEKTVAEKEEMKAVGAYNMIAQTLHDQISKQTDSRDKKTADKQGAEKSSAMASGQKGDTEAALAADKEYLSELKGDCAEKAKEFETKQKTRAAELVALNKAIEIISSPAVSGGSFVQKRPRATALVQLRASDKAAQPFQNRVQSYLLEKGQKLNSNVLSALAMRVSADPLAKVKKMIQDMVYKLMEEANEEAEHKGFCDTEMGKNKNTRDMKSSKVEELTASIEEMTAQAEVLTSEAAALTEDVTAIDMAVSEATSQRTAESTKNKQTIEDAVAGKEAVQSAVKVLKDFYEGEGAASFIQTSMTTGAKGAEGILGMLEVILSDFERLESETSSAEETAADAHTKFLRTSKKTKAVANTDIKHKQNEVQRLESETAEAKKELKITQEELDAAMEYFEKLKPSCVEAGESYEERVARRKEEIESLQDAMKILSGDM
jgi:peptidoglycan hydrolase CwlO-like protein